MLASPAPRGDRAVLEDATGRRGRWMRRLGRTATLLVFCWLVVLLVGGLGLTPVANLPLAEVLRPSQGPEPLAGVPKPRRPPADDLRPARPVATPTTTPAEPAVVSLPAPSTRSRPIRRVRRLTPTARGNTRRAPPRTVAPPARLEPAPLPTNTPPGRTRTASPGRSGQAPAHAETGTSPGRSASAPGQVNRTTSTTTTTVTETTAGPKGPKK
jgi:hypothetical protein